mmetsp:Transcript_116409/g.292778  ORF Transcript_116409/g.292778 Transcript_116409/m.292778 type:complete len:354 (-) Transcript_116409:65-1126(-)
MWGDRDSKGKGSGRDGGKGGDRWRNRDDRMLDENVPQQYHHSLEGGLRGSQSDSPLKCVQIDALVFLQIMKHCRQHTPHPVTGQLLGLDVEDTLQVTHSFGYVQRGSGDDAGNQDDGSQYQIDTLKRLREVNVDSNIVGWYQTTHLGQFFSSTVIETQFLYQTEIPRSVLVVYDSLQSAIGKPAFKALQLTPEFMTTYAQANEMGRAAMADFPSSDMFMEIPVSISSSVIAEAFLVDWAISDPISTTSQVGILDVENQAFLEKNVQLLIGSLQELAEEQQKLIMYERNAARKGDPPQKGGRDRFNRNVQPRHLDTMVLSQQIQNYCKAINGYAGDAFGKIFLMSNKPSGSGKK